MKSRKTMNRQTDGTHAAGKPVRESLKTVVLRAEEGKARAEAIIAAIGDGVSIQDPNFKILYQNEIHKELVGDHGGEYCHSAYRHCDSICDGCPLEMSFRDGNVHRMETTNITPRGTIPIEITASSLRDSTGKAVAGIEIVRDITKRRQTEDALQAAMRHAEEEKAKTEAMIAAIGDGVSIQDTGFKITYQNEIHKQLVGDHRGEYCYQAYEHSESICAECPVAMAFKDGNAHTVERSTRTDRGELHVEITASPLKDSTGNIIAGIEIVRDIGERKRAEERQDQLLQELESINKELNDFAYIVSHDLKAPLRGIGSLVNWIAADYADTFDQQGKEQLDLLLGRVNRMHTLIEGILQYSRTGRTSEETVEVNLNDLVKQVIDFLSLPDTIKITFENGLPTITGERIRIGQVFQNLIGNAAKFMDKPEGTIRIGCVADGEYYTFSVSDNGPGIEEKHFDRIFQIFQTLLSRDQFESTGVGLALVKKIVDMYGGRVWVESRVGQGSTFFFTLPKGEMNHETKKTDPPR